MNECQKEQCLIVKEIYLYITDHTLLCRPPIEISCVLKKKVPIYLTDRQDRVSDKNPLSFFVKYPQKLYCDYTLRFHCLIGEPLK